MKGWVSSFVPNGLPRRSGRPCSRHAGLSALSPKLWETEDVGLSPEAGAAPHEPLLCHQVLPLLSGECSLVAG